MCGESNMETYIAICKIDNSNLLYVSKLKQEFYIQLEGWDEREMGGRFKREGTYVCLWLIHDHVWQKL